MGCDRSRSRSGMPPFWQSLKSKPNAMNANEAIQHLYCTCLLQLMMVNQLATEWHPHTTCIHHSTVYIQISESSRMIGNANKSIQSLYVACLLQLMMVEQLATESQTPYIHEKRLWTHFLEIATHTKWPQTDAPTIWTVPENCAIGVCSMDFEFVPWMFHGCSMVVPWFHGCSMVVPWLFHGCSMVVP